MHFKLFPSSKIDFLAIFKIGKKWNLVKKIFREIDLFDFMQSPFDISQQNVICIFCRIRSQFTSKRERYVHSSSVEENTGAISPIRQQGRPSPRQGKSIAT